MHYDEDQDVDPDSLAATLHTGKPALEVPYVLAVCSIHPITTHAGK